MKNRHASEALYERFQSTHASPFTTGDPHPLVWQMVLDVLGRALVHLRCDGLPVGVFYELSRQETAEDHPSFGAAIDLMTLRRIGLSSRNRLEVSYPRNALRNALLAPVWQFPPDSAAPAREDYEICECGKFTVVTHVEIPGVHYRPEPRGVGHYAQ